MSISNTYKISLFDKALHNRSAFSCGIETIDRWLKTSITSQIKDNRVRVYCAVDEDKKLVGFYGLNAQSIRIADGGLLAKSGGRHDIPTIYLPCIGVDSQYQGKDLGTALMGHAIKTSVVIADQIGATALILDVKEDKDFERRLRFYTKLGFSLLGGSEQSRVFLSMKTARLSVEKLKSTQSAPVT